MRSNVLAMVAMVAVPSMLQSQSLPRPEIGIRMGMIQQTTKSGGFTDKQTAIVIPDGLFSGGGLHWLVFLAPRIGIEPQFGLMRISSSGSTFTVRSIGVQGNGFFGPDATRAPYGFVLVRQLQNDDSGSGFSSSESRTGMGAGLGYRRVYRESIAMRYEARLEKWSGAGESSTQFALLVALGAVIRK